MTRALTTRSRWFVRGMLIGLLLCGATNAASYYFRSDGLGDLLGTHPARNEALGFPLEMWQDGNAYGGYYVDLPALAVNLLFAAALGAALGAGMVAGRRRLDRLEEELEANLDQGSGRAQITMGGVLAAMCLACGGAAVARFALAGRPEALGAIYLFGPWALVAIALLPRRIAWQRRVAILVPVTVVLTVAAVVVGTSLERPLDFDKVLLGIFVSWTPQTALGAVVLTVAILASGFKAERVSSRG